MATGSEGAFPARTEAKTLRELEEESMRVAKEVKNWEIETVLHFFCKKRENMPLVIQIFPKSIFKSVEGHISSFLFHFFKKISFLNRSKVFLHRIVSFLSS